MKLHAKVKLLVNGMINEFNCAEMVERQQQTEKDALRDTFNDHKYFADINHELNNLLKEEDPELAQKMGIIKAEDDKSSTFSERQKGEDGEDQNNLEGQIKEIVDKFTEQLDKELKQKLQDTQNEVRVLLRSGFDKNQDKQDVQNKEL